MFKAEGGDRRLNRLVVIPSDPIAAYEAKGIGARLETYYNPKKWFGDVFALSPLERGTRRAYGMTIIESSYRDLPIHLKRLQPGVVRAYGGFWPSDFACLGRIPSLPVLVSVHDTNPDLLHPSISYADLVLCVSKTVADKVIEGGTSPDRIRILPNRVDPSVFHPVANADQLDSVARQFPPWKPILHVGRKTHQKNLDTLIRAIKFLPPEYFAVFVGAGDSSKFVELAREIGVASRCFWRESVPNSELPIWYSWAACVCTPSRWEGFGVVFLEAAACGAAIITSDIAPMNEYLEKDVSACLVSEYENSRTIAGAILKVCTDELYRQTIQRGAVQTAKSFEKSAIDSAEIGIYEEALKLKPRTITQMERFRLRASLFAHRATTRARDFKNKLERVLA